MESSPSKQVVLAFWDRMRTNDFGSIGDLITDDFVLDWPQTRERIVGLEKFEEVNSTYPAGGTWTFELHKIVDAGSTVVTIVGVSDSVVNDTAITFFEIRDAKIAKITEYWPESSEPPEWRLGMVERL
jgi:ketosteroid isomerase-like protein